MVIEIHVLFAIEAHLLAIDRIHTTIDSLKTF